LAKPGGNFGANNSLNSFKSQKDILKSKDIDEGQLIAILNKYWSKASFGYPIHEDVRIPTSVAEVLRAENEKHVEKATQEENGDTKMDMLEVFRLNVLEML